MGIISITFTLFLIMNVLGIIPPILKLTAHLPAKEQKRLLLKEAAIALIIIYFFNWLGERVFGWLNVSDSTIEMAGGLILLIIAIRMVFPSIARFNIDHSEQEELFIVPIAVPFIASPSLLTTVMVFARHEPNPWVMIGAILIAMSATAVILFFAQELKNLVKDKGLVALQRLMGLLLTLIAVQILLQGISHFVTTNFLKGA
jgi:multiple antibiotic resistance protein